MLGKTPRIPGLKPGIPDAVVPPAVRASDAIAGKARELGLGAAHADSPAPLPTPAPRSDGFWQRFERGWVYWTAKTGAHEVTGAIFGKWAELHWEQGFLGFPVTDETATPDTVGRYNHFEAGSIYWTPQTGAHEVHGDIRALWAQSGWERSALGYPTSDEYGTPDGAGRRSDFQHGAIVWDPHTGPRIEQDAAPAVSVDSGASASPEPPTQAPVAQDDSTTTDAALSGVGETPAAPPDATVPEMSSGDATPLPVSSMPAAAPVPLPPMSPTGIIRLDFEGPFGEAPSWMPPTPYVPAAPSRLDFGGDARPNPAWTPPPPYVPGPPLRADFEATRPLDPR